jgi:DNA-binding winged helix-turn-helix (wHTH) protein
MSLGKFPDLLLNISGADMRPAEIHSYRFKSFTLEPAERQLFDRDRRVSLSPKAFDVLTLLIVNPGHLVTREELFETIWADSFVEEANLARVVHTIRKTLGEDENGNKFIETVPTKGYRFVGEVERVIDPPRENQETFATNGPDAFLAQPLGARAWANKAYAHDISGATSGSVDRSKHPMRDVPLFIFGWPVGTRE